MVLRHKEVLVEGNREITRLDRFAAGVTAYPEKSIPLAMKDFTGRDRSMEELRDTFFHEVCHLESDFYGRVVRGDSTPGRNGTVKKLLSQNPVFMEAYNQDIQGAQKSGRLSRVPSYGRTWKMGGDWETENQAHEEMFAMVCSSMRSGVKKGPFGSQSLQQNMPQTFRAVAEMLSELDHQYGSREFNYRIVTAPGDTPVVISSAARRQQAAAFNAGR